MYERKIKKIMEEVYWNKIKVDDAVQKLKFLPFEDIGHTKIDHHRALRKGFPEVVFCQSKTAKQVAEIVRKLSQNNKVVLATRATEEMFNEVKRHIKDSEYNNKSKTIIIDKNKKNRINKKKGKILVLTAGTSDINVAEE